MIRNSSWFIVTAGTLVCLAGWRIAAPAIVTASGVAAVPAGTTHIEMDHEVLPTVKPTSDAPIIDSALTLNEALQGKSIPEEIAARLTIVDIVYWSFDDRLHQGQLVIDHDLTDEVRAIFAELRAARFPIEKMIPVCNYGWSDDASMADNNSSGFNYRVVLGRDLLSKHATGHAIDINPRLNPYIVNGKIMPQGAVYDPDAPGTIVDSGVVVRAFTNRGWTWGGHWTGLKDWQHFEK